MTHCQNGYRTVAVARVSGAEKRMGRRPPRSAKEPPSAGYGRVACSCQSMRQVVCFVVVQVGPFRYCAVELSVSTSLKWTVMVVSHAAAGQIVPEPSMGLATATHSALMTSSS